MRRLDGTGLAGMIAALWLTGLAGLGAAGQTPVPPSVVDAGLGGLSNGSPIPSCSGKLSETILCHGRTFDVTVMPSIPGEAAATPTARRVLPQPGEPKIKEKYDFRYVIQPRLIALKMDKNGVRRGAIEFEIDARNPKGRLVFLVSQMANLRFSDDDYAEFLKTPFKFFQQMDLPPGKFTLLIGVLDRVAEMSQQVKISLTVPAKVGS